MKEQRKRTRMSIEEIDSMLISLWGAGYMYGPTFLALPLSRRAQGLMMLAFDIGMEDEAIEVFNQGVAASVKGVSNPSGSTGSSEPDKRYWLRLEGADGKLDTCGVFLDVGRAKAVAKNIRASGVPGPLYVHEGTGESFNPNPLWAIDYDDLATTISPQSEQAAEYFSYWIDPDGGVYPVSTYGHDSVQDQLVARGVIVQNGQSATLFNYAPALASGWIRLSINRGSPTFGFVGKRPKQHQIDAVFDLALAHKARKGDEHQRFYRALMEWLASPANGLSFIGNPSGHRMPGKDALAAAAQAALDADWGRSVTVSSDELTDFMFTYLGADRCAETAKLAERALISEIQRREP